MHQGYRELDEVIARVSRHANAKFLIELGQREQRRYETLKDDATLLRHFATIVAYSQAAKSAPIDRLLSKSTFADAFSQFDVDIVSEMNPCVVVETHWKDIAAIRQKAKVFQIVMAARAIKRHRHALSELLAPSALPMRVSTEQDIASFWDGFKKLKKALKSFDIPFLSETTSLLHLLMHVGADCIKPDSAVQRAAANTLQWPSTGGKDKRLCDLVRRAQTYALHRGLRPGVVDLYLLIEGKQSWASGLVDPAYYADSKFIESAQ